MTSRCEEAPGRETQDQPSEPQRLDKWLWFARVSKSRTLAAALIEAGKVRVNRTRATKPSQAVRPGDVLTIALRGHVQVLKVAAPGVRRGPPAEARQLYVVLTPAATTSPPRNLMAAVRNRGTGRPTKRERRLTDRLNEQD
jgi:ribosome-associated heat shock protein Hsp15